LLQALYYPFVGHHNKVYQKAQIKNYSVPPPIKCTLLRHTEIDLAKESCYLSLALPVQ
jgi:hypothetical protein